MSWCKATTDCLLSIYRTKSRAYKREILNRLLQLENFFASSGKGSICMVRKKFWCEIQNELTGLALICLVSQKKCLYLFDELFRK